MLATSTSRCCSTRLTNASAAAFGTMPPRAIGSTIFSASSCRADALLVALLGNPGLGEHPLVDLQRETVAFAEARVRGDSLEDLRIRRLKVEIDALAFHQSLAKQLLQQVETHLGVVEDRRIDALRASPERLLLVAHGLRELDLGDLAALELRDLRRTVAAPEVVVDSEERERNHDQREDELRDALVLVNEIKHRLGSILSARAFGRAAPCADERRRPPPAIPRRAETARCEKGELAFALRIGGVDGTRTRDPRRDRPVF